jgi:hypothetical protein
MDEEPLVFARHATPLGTFRSCHSSTGTTSCFGGSQRSIDTVSSVDTVELICQAADLSPRAGKFTWRDLDAAVEKLRVDNNALNQRRRFDLCSSSALGSNCGASAASTEEGDESRISFGSSSRSFGVESELSPPGSIRDVILDSSL